MQTLECPKCDEYLDDLVPKNLECGDEFECPTCKTMLILRYWFEPENESFDYFEEKFDNLE